MAQETVFGEVIGFLNRLGVYDIILPFLLIFSIVFAILEKTKVLGTDEIEGKKYSKKSINAIVAFVISFLVVASANLVKVINTAVANIALLMVILVMFLLLVGTMFGDKEVTLENYPGWTKFFMVVLFIGIVVIFLHALGWLETVFSFLIDYYDVSWVATLILLVIIIVFMVYVTKDSGKPKTSEKKEG
ncbi:MAG: hypothetical protein KAT77_05035 [Nanoarchaeota archaeon]|nr:hypothetical protein [Nanoarchaeota archaeon]